MRALRSLAVAAVLAVTLSGCETKVTRISVVCRPGDQITEPVRWLYTSKVDPSVIKRIPRSIDITLHYTGGDPRAVPPITTYFYREGDGTLRVASTAKTTIPPKGTFTYHVDTGGYDLALTRAGHGEAEQLVFFIEVDGFYFGGLLSPPTCGRWADGHIDVAKSAEVPNLKDKRPLNLASGDWLEVSSLPTAVVRTEGSEVSTYAFFKAPIGLTEVKNATGVPDDPAKQAAEVGVTPATPTYALTGDPPPYVGVAPGGSAPGAPAAAKLPEKSGGNP